MTKRDSSRGTERVTRRQVVLCYRHDDTGSHAERLYKHLVDTLGDLVVKSSDIDQGDAESSLAACGALVVIIGRNTFPQMAVGEAHERANPMLTEVAGALEMRLPVMPVLVDGAQMPSAATLPPQLAALSHINAIELRHTAFARDAQELTDVLLKQLASARTTTLDRMFNRFYRGSSGKLRNWAAFAALGFAAYGAFVLIVIAVHWSSMGPKALIYHTMDEQDPDIGMALAATLMTLLAGFFGRLSVRWHRFARVAIWMSVALTAIGVGMAAYYLLFVPGTRFSDFQ